MSPTIVIYGFETSNNMKVRVALGYKKIPYEFRSIDPADRAEVVRISGQHLTPVLVHGTVKLFDSAAILRYLDANYLETPRLFGSSGLEQWAIEDWELFARTELAGPMMRVVHTRIAGGTVDAAMTAACENDFADAVRRIAGALTGREWLVGDSMSAADITAAAVIHRVRVSKLLAIPDKADSIQPWVMSVMAFDAHGTT